MFRKYDSIPGIHKVSGKFFNKGDIIEVTEKLDGANFSFGKDEEGNIRYFSRNNEVTGTTFRGAVPYIEEKIKSAPYFSPGFLFYGEWLVRHRVNYTAEVANTFNIFDIWMVKKECYAPREAVQVVASMFGFNTPEILYSGEYQSIEHLREMVGKSNVAAGMEGEGIVIRNVTQGTMCKWVRDGFMEHQIPKVVKQVNNEIISYIEQFCTYGRIGKILHKGIDDGIYTDFERTSMGAIMKHCVPAIVKDILEEESDVILPEHRDEFIKVANKRLPIMIKGAIDNDSK